MDFWLPSTWNVNYLSDLGLSRDHLDMSSWPEYSFSIQWKINSSNPWWSRAMKYGEVACSLAHHEAWSIASKNDEYTVVLEDDSQGHKDIDILLPEIIEKLSKLDHMWELLYLGRVAMATDTEFCTEKLVVPGYSHCTYAYVLSSAGARKLLRNDILNNMMPVDEFLPACFCKHPRDDIEALQFTKLRAYSVQPEVVSQRHKKVFGSHTESSAFLS